MAARSNQQLRTRTALINAATELLREGRAPSMPEAAERALVSNATAYRYFSSAEELWQEASRTAAQFGPMLDEADAHMIEAGEDPHARLEIAVREVGWRMLDDQLPCRLLAKSALDRWFSQATLPPDERVPVREGRRNRQSRRVVEPLEGKLSPGDLRRLEAALGVVLGTDSMLALTDAVGLDVDTAKEVMLDAARWLLAGALAEMAPDDS